MGTGEAQDDAQSLPPQPPAAAAPPPVYTQLHVDGIGFPGLQLKHAADRGYYIATGGWVNAGSTLLQEPPLAASTVACGALPSYCQRCLTALSGVTSSKRAACDGCQALVYCSQYCRERDARIHGPSGECALLRSRDAARELGPWLRDAAVALRLLWLGPLEPPLACPGIETLSPAAAAAARAAARAALAAARAAADEAGGAAPAAAVTEADVTAAVLRVAANSLEFDLSHPGDPGAAPACAPLVVYRAACRLNHSCRPNAAFHFLPGGKICVRSTRDIGGGGEITICYLDPVACDLEERRAQLRGRYGFDCTCPRCEENGRRARHDARRPAGAAAAEASRRAADAVAEAGELFLTQDDAQGCAALLERDLVPALLAPGSGDAARTAPAVQLTSAAALQGLTLLASACNVLASQEREEEPRGARERRQGDQEDAQGAEGQARGERQRRRLDQQEQGSTPGDGGGARLREAAAAALLLALAGEQLVFEGETAALRHAGGFWLQVAGLASRLLAADHSDRNGCGNGSSSGGGGSGVEGGSGGGEAEQAAGGPAGEDGGPWPAGLPSAHPGLAPAARRLWAEVAAAIPPPGPQGGEGGGGGGEARVKRRRGEAGTGAEGQAAGGAGEGDWAGLEGQGLTWLAAWGREPEPRPPAAAGGAAAPAAALEAAAAHAAARARALLAHCYGPLHAAAEAAAFSPLFARGLPYTAGARLAQRAAALFEAAPRREPPPHAR